jgi:hypothetical protein
LEFLIVCLLSLYLWERTFRTLPGVPVENICIKTCQQFFLNIRLIPTFHVSLDSIYSSAAECATILILISLTVCVLMSVSTTLTYEPAHRMTLFF